MFKLILLALATLVAVQATGDLVILHSPDSVTFKGNEEVNQSLLKEICAAALGFTVKQKSTWSGISINNPFHLPEAFVGFAVEGINSLHSPRGKRFPLNVDEVEETTWQALSGRLEERDNDNTLVRIYLGDGLDALGQSALGELKPTAIDESSLKFLSLENEEDRKFLEEIQLLRAIAQKVPSAIRADSIPDVYWLVVSEIRPVLDFHGEESAAAKEALTLLNDALSDVSKAFMDVYENKVLIAAFTNDASQVRHTRSVILERQTRDTASNTSSGSGTKIKRSSEIKQTATDNEINTTEKPEQQDDIDEKNKYITNEDGTEVGATSGDNNNDNSEHANNPIEQTTDSTNGAKQAEKSSTGKEVIRDIHQLNLSKDYDEDYPVIFNILLWFGVVFFFSLLAICIAIADMDPGRDSIIYRMTSNRMKKDN